MRVFLTGGSGFIAAHVLDQLIQRGHSVVTTVRSFEKADGIRKAYANVGKDRLDFAIVEDIAQKDAFDAAVVSTPPFEAVIHTASPFHFNVTDIQKDLLDPALNGTSGILRSIQKYAPTVKKVIITSSWAAVVNPFKGYWPEHTYSEDDWNPINPEQALESIPNGYRASKTFAEKAAWDFLEQEKPSFSITTLCPPQVLGPVIHQLSSLSNLNTSNQVVRDLLQGKFKDGLPTNATFIWVDVRDLASCHVLALETPEAANRRFLVTAGRFSNKALAGIVRKSFKQYEKVLPAEATSDGDYPKGGLFQVDASQVVKVLGVSWKTLETCIVDTVNSLRNLEP